MLLEEIHVTLAHLEKKRTRLRLYTKSFEEIVHTESGEGVANPKRRRQDFQDDSVRDLVTTSERSRLKKALEESTCPEYIRPSSYRAHLAPKQHVQVKKISSSCEICSGPHDTQYCMENPEQAFVEYASSHTDEARGKWFTFKPDQNKLGDTYNSSWKSRPNLRWRQPQNSQNNFLNPPNRFQPNGSFPNCSFNNNPQNFNNQSNLKGLVSNFMVSQDARLSKFEANFKQQQSEMTNKIDTVLKAITDRITGELPSDTVKNPTLNVNSTSLILSARSYPMEDPQCSSRIHSLINTTIICPNQPNKSCDDKSEGEEEEKKYDDSREEDENTMIEWLGVEYFDIFPTKRELAYHKKFFKKNKKEIFTVAGDGVRIYPDGVIFDEKKLESS
ncbi:hypothetical protein Tco_0696669 [Tanacetum coccineum]